MSYTDFISENIAPYLANKIGVYDSNGNKVGKIELSSTFKPTNLGNKLYSFGAISDVHVQDNTAQADFQRALTYLNNNESVAFTCICGDLTSGGTTEHLEQYKGYVESYSPNTPVYAMTGNHEGYNSSIESIIETYTGHPLYYSFEYQGDVFIFVGVKSSTNAQLFTTAELQWLYETLEANRNKRCFVFEHVRPQDGCGNACGIYSYDIWGGTEQAVFESLLRHYKNIILFHGHSHLKFNLQSLSDVANYDNIFGIHSVHIPSLAVPRTGDASGSSSRVEVYSDSEGYVIDVYENHIILRGRDFVAEKFLPIAQYCLDTTLQNIDANTYTDSTGTIDTTTSYSITNTLSNVTNSNNATSVAKNGSYSAIITPNSGYIIQSIVVSMGGIDVTNSVYSNGTITINEVTGNIEINAAAILNAVSCTGISLNNTSLEFTTTDSKTLVATVTPSNTTDLIVWESSDTSIATVENGIVTPKGKGNCKITANCGSKSATCDIIVNAIILTWSIGTKISTYNGSETQDSRYSASQYIKVESSNVYTIKTNLNETTEDAKENSVKICFYKDDKTFLGCSDTLVSTLTSVGKYPSSNIELLENTSYIRVRAYCLTSSSYEESIKAWSLSESIV